MGVKRKVDAWLATPRGERIARWYRGVALVGAGLVVALTDSIGVRISMLVLIILLAMVLAEEAMKAAQRDEVRHGGELWHSYDGKPEKHTTWIDGEGVEIETRGAIDPERKSFLQRANKAATDNKPLIDAIQGLLLPITTTVAAIVWLITRIF